MLMILSWLSLAYINQAVESCFSLLKQLACAAFSLALDKAGSRSDARMAIIAITTSNSISVNAFNLDRTRKLLEGLQRDGSIAVSIIQQDGLFRPGTGADSQPPETPTWIVLEPK